MNVAFRGLRRNITMFSLKNDFSNVYSTHKKLRPDPDPAWIRTEQSLESGLNPYNIQVPIQQQSPESEFSKIPGPDPDAVNLDTKQWCKQKKNNKQWELKFNSKKGTPFNTVLGFIKKKLRNVGLKGPSISSQIRFFFKRVCS